jgi:hypothetical protein
MRKKKFSKERFYRRLEARNKKTVSKSETDWDVMQSGYPDCLIYPDFFSDMEVELIRKPLFSKRRGRGGFVEHEALGFDESFQQLQHTESAENLRADGFFFNARNSPKQPEPKPEFVPPPPLEKFETFSPDNDSGSFGWYFLKLVAFTACVALLCEFLQKLSQ